MKNKIIPVKSTEEFRNEVRQAANQDNKTMTGYITDLILEDFKKRGLRNGTGKENRTENYGRRKQGKHG